MGKSFKGFSKALSLILAVAMVVTCVPTSAYAAELLTDASEDILVNDTLVEESDALVDASASEEKSSTSIDTQKEADLATAPNENKSGKEDFGPDGSNNDITVTLADGANMKMYTKSGDTYTNTHTGGSASSEDGYVVYMKPDAGFKMGDTPKLVLTYKDVSGLEAHKAGVADDANTADGAKVVTAETTDQGASTYTIGAVNDDGYYPITFTTAFFNKLLYLKDGTTRKKGSGDAVEYTAALTIKACDAVSDTFLLEVVKGGSYELNTLTDARKTGTYDNDYSLVLSGDSGAIKGKDNKLTTSGIKAAEITVEEVKKDGTTTPITVAAAGDAAGGLLEGMKADAVDGTAKAVLAGYDSWKTGAVTYVPADPTVAEKTLFIAKSVINEVYEANHDKDTTNDLTLRVTIGKEAAAVKKYTITATDTDYITYTFFSGVEDEETSGNTKTGYVLDKDETGATDVVVKADVKSQPNYQTGNNAVNRKIKDFTYQVAGSDEQTSAINDVTTGNKTITVAELTGNITLSSYTTETVYENTGADADIYDEKGTKVNTSTVVKTGEAFKFTVRCAKGYELNTTNGVTYKLGNEDGDGHVLTADANGVYTTPAVNETINLYVNTKAVGQLWKVKKSGDTAANATVKDNDGATTITTSYSATGLATNNQKYYFTVEPATTAYSIAKVEYKIGTGDAVEATKVYPTGTVYCTKTGVTADLDIIVTVAGVAKVYGPKNPNVKMYARIDGADVELKSDTATNISAAGDLYFKVVADEGSEIVNPASDVGYIIASARADKDVNTAITSEGQGSIAKSVLAGVAASDSIWFYVATTTTKTEGKDFSVYFTSSSPTPADVKIKDVPSTDKKELVGQSLTLAQSEKVTIGYDLYTDKKITLNENTGAVTNAAGQKIDVSSGYTKTFALEKTEAGEKVAEITAAGALTTDNAGAEWNIGSDYVVATITKNAADANGVKDKYEIELPIEVKEHYTDFKVKATLNDDAANNDEITTSAIGDGTVYFTVEGRNGRTEKWEDVKTTLPGCIDSIKWTCDSYSADDVTPLVTYAAHNTNQTKITAVSFTEPKEVNVTAEIKQKGNIKTTVTKSAKINYVAAHKPYVVVPSVTVNGGSEKFGAAALTTATGFVKLQKAATLNSATVVYDVYELTADGVTVCGASYSNNAANMAKALLTSKANVKKYTEDAGTVYFKKVTSGLEFANDTATTNWKDNTFPTVEEIKEATDPTEYGVVYATAAKAAGTGNYTITAAKKTGISVVGSKTVYAMFKPSIKVNSVPIAAASITPVYFTVANAFDTADLTLILKDADNKDTDGNPIVQVLGSDYLSAYKRAQYLDSGKETGQVIKAVTKNSKIALPTEAQLASTTGSSRKLVGFSTGSTNYYAPGEEVDFTAAATYTAIWTDKYVFDSIYNKNKATTDADGKTTYGTKIAGGTVVTIAMAETGVIPVVGLIKTATGIVTDAEKAADASLPSPGTKEYDENYLESGVSLDYLTGSTTSEKQSVPVEGLNIKAGAAGSAKLVATYTSGSDKYVMDTNATGDYFTVNVGSTITYAITAPTSVPTYYVNENTDAKTLNVTVKKDGGNHGLTKEDFVITSDETKIKVEATAASAQIVTLKFTPVAVGTSKVTISVKDSQGITSDPVEFNVEVKDEGISFAFYDEKGTTKIDKLDVAASGSGKFIARAEKNGVALQDGTWGSFTYDSNVVNSATPALETGYGRIVTVVAKNAFRSDGYVQAEYTSAANIKYTQKLTVRAYKPVMFGTLAKPGAKEILVNGTAYKENDVLKNYPYKVFLEDKNADNKYEVTLDGLTATYDPSVAGETKDFTGWVDGTVITTATKTGKAIFTDTQITTGVTFTAQFEDSAITFDGINDNEVIVLDPTSDATNHKTFELVVDPATSSKAITVTPKKKGFYHTYNKAAVASDDCWDANKKYKTDQGASAGAINVVATAASEGRRVDSFTVGIVNNTAGYTDFEAEAGEYKKTFTLVSKGADFANPTIPALGGIKRYVDYDATKGAYEVTLDKRAVKSADGTTVNQDVYFDKDGLPVQYGVVTLTNGDGKSYLINNYKLTYGSKGGSLKTVNGKDYFVDENGIATVSEKVTISGKDYYFNNEGAMVKYADATLERGTDAAGKKYGKYVDPETNIKWVIYEDNTAKQDDIYYNPVVKWTVGFDKKFTKGSPAPVLKYTITYTSKESGKDTTTEEISVTAETSQDTSATSTATEIKFTATADLAGYFVDKDGKTAATVENVKDAKVEKTYKFSNDKPTSKTDGLTVEGLEASYEFTGNPIKPAFTVIDSELDKVLVEKTDYTVKWTNNNPNAKATLPVTAVVTITGKGNYDSKVITREFQIVDPMDGETATDYFDVKSVKVEKETTPLVFDGTPKYPSKLTIKTADKKEITATWNGSSYDLSDTSKELKIVVTNNVSKGSGTVSVFGSDFKKPVKKTFSIAAADLSTLGEKLEITADAAKYTKTGAKAKVTVTFDNGSEKLTLVEGRDYKVTYAYPLKKDAGEKGGQAYITGKNNFKGNTKKTNVASFDIEKLVLSDDNVIVDAYEKVAAKSIKVKVFDSEGNEVAAKNYSITKVEKGSDDITGSSYKLAAGDDITVTVKGSGTNVDEAEHSVNVTVAAKMSGAKFNTKSLTKYYNGDVVELDSEDLEKVIATVKINKVDTKLEAGTDYEVVGYKGNNKKGTMTVYVRGISDKVSGYGKFTVKLLPKQIVDADK